MPFSVTSKKVPSANQRYASDQLCFCKTRLQAFTQNKCFPFHEVFKYLPRGYIFEEALFWLQIKHFNKYKKVLWSEHVEVEYCEHNIVLYFFP